MPADSFSLSVRVACQKNTVSGAGFFFQLSDQLTLTANIDIFRFKVIFQIHPQGAFGKIADMSLTCNDLISASQKAFDGRGFGW